jgi:hypothetical protein
VDLKNPFIEETSEKKTTKKTTNQGFSAVGIQIYCTQLEVDVKVKILEMMKGNNVWGTDDHWTSKDWASMSGKSFQWIDSSSIQK